MTPDPVSTPSPEELFQLRSRGDALLTALPFMRQNSEPSAVKWAEDAAKVIQDLFGALLRADTARSADATRHQQEIAGLRRVANAAMRIAEGDAAEARDAAEHWSERAKQAEAERDDLASQLDALKKQYTKKDG